MKYYYYNTNNEKIVYDSLYQLFDDLLPENWEVGMLNRMQGYVKIYNDYYKAGEVLYKANPEKMKQVRTDGIEDLKRAYNRDIEEYMWTNNIPCFDGVWAKVPELDFMPIYIQDNEDD